MAGAQEKTALRTRDQSIYLNPNGTYTAVFGKDLHYRASNGTWQDVDLTLRPSGSSYVVDHNNVAITVTSSGIQAVDPGTGKGILWSIPSRPDVSSNSASFTGPLGLKWTYFPTHVGIKAQALVSSPIGSNVVTFSYSLVGGAAPLQFIGGSVVGDGFVVPPPTAIGSDHQIYPLGSWSAGPGAGQVSVTIDDSGVPAAAYPYELDPTTTFNAGASGDDGFVNRPGATYPPTGTINVDTTSTTFAPEREFVSGTYRIKNALVRWDTSSLGPNAAISSASLSVNVTSSVDANSRAMTAEWYSAWPIDSSDYTNVAGTSASGQTGWSVASLTNGVHALGLEGLDNVSRTGYTGLRLHINGSTPTGDNIVWMSTYDDPSLQEPRLIVNYALPPTLDSPTPNATVPTTTPVFKATSDPGDGSALQYSFEILAAGNTTNCSGALLTSSGWLPSTNTWTIGPGALNDGHTYYWCARVMTQSGEATAFSGPQSFNVRTAKLGSRPSWPMWSHGGISINQMTGNMLTAAPGPSYPTAAGSMGTSLTYNSKDTSDRGFGAGWALEVGDSLSSPPEKLIDHSALTGSDYVDAVEIVLPDGSSDYYTHVGNSNVYKSPPGVTSVLSKSVVNGTFSAWTFYDEDGSVYTFPAGTDTNNPNSNDGVTGEYRLGTAEIADATPGVGALTYTFSGNKIASIRDTSNRALTFNWSCSGALLCVTGPDSVSWKYIGTDASGGTAAPLTRVNDGTRDVVRYTYVTGTTLISKIQNANDLAQPTDLGFANLSPGYDQSHSLQVAYDSSNRATTVTDGPVSDQSTANSVWTIGYFPGSVAATPTRAAHGATPSGSARTADGYATVTPPNQQGAPSPKSTTTYYDSIGHVVEVDDPLGHITEISYNAIDQLDWSEDPSGAPTDNTYDSVDNVLLTSTGPDPDGAGPLSRPITTNRYDETAIGTSSSRGAPLTGLQGSYFSNTSLTGRPAARINDATNGVNFAWGTAGPGVAGFTPTSNYSVRWEGELEPSTSCSPYFSVTHTDGVRLVVDGGTLINDWVNHSTPVTDTSFFNPPYTAGTRYKINLEYYVGGSTSSTQIALDWTCGGSSTPIPGSLFLPAWLNQTSTVDPVGRVGFHHFADPSAGHPDYDLMKNGSQNVITSYQYDSAGRITTKIMPKGNTCATIDAQGTLNQPSGCPDTSYSTSWTYYTPSETATIAAGCSLGGTVAQGGLLKSKQVAGLAASTFMYDVAGRTVASTEAAGTTLGCYDAEGRLTQDKAPGESSYATYAYDPAGAQRTTANSAGTVSSEYDEMGRMHKTTDTTGATTTYAYDSNGNVLSKATSSIGTTGYTYDGGDQLSTMTDPQNKLTTYASYDAAGRLLQKDLPNATHVDYGYNAGGWLLFVHNRSGSSHGNTEYSNGDTDYTYNDDGKVATETLPGYLSTSVVPQTGTVSSSGPTSQSYQISPTAQGAIFASLDWSSTTRPFSFSSQSIAAAPVGGTTTVSRYITVSAPGPISGSLDWANAAVTMTYNLYNPSGTLVSSNTNATQKPKPIAYTVPSGAYGTYRVDVVSHTPLATTFTLTGSTPVYADLNLQLVNSVGTTVAQTTSASARPETLSYTPPVTDLNPYTLKVIAVSDDATYTLNYLYPTKNVRTYTYDNLGRLTDAVDTSSRHYTYDLDSNRTSFTNGSATDTYTVNPMDQLTQVSRLAGTEAFTYDSDGQMTKDVRPGFITRNLQKSGVVDVAGTATQSYAFTPTAAGPFNASVDWSSTTRPFSFPSQSIAAAPVGGTTTVSRNITVSAPGPITGSLDWANAAVTMTYNLYNQAGTLVASNTNATQKPKPISYTVPTGAYGTYRIDVVNHTPLATTFTLTGSTPVYADLNLQLVNSVGTTVAQTTSTSARPETLSYSIPGTDLNPYTVKVVAASDNGNYTLNYSYSAEDADTYTYDGRGRPLTEDNSLNRASWTLDGLGRVVETKTTDWTGVAVSDMAYSYDDSGDARVSETPVGQTTPSTIYVGDPAGLLKTVSGSTVQYEYFNAHGDTVQNADEVGNTTYSVPLVYDEFGNPAVNAPTPYGWNGKQQRDTSSLTRTIRMGVRLYDPALARFMSVDPVEGGSLNNYDYADADPVNNSDIAGTHTIENDGLGDMGGRVFNDIGYHKKKKHHFHWGGLFNWAKKIVYTAAVGAFAGAVCWGTAGVGCLIAVGALSGGAVGAIDYYTTHDSYSDRRTSAGWVSNIGFGAASGIGSAGGFSWLRSGSKLARRIFQMRWYR